MKTICASGYAEPGAAVQRIADRGSAGERKDPSEQPETDHPRIEHRPSREAKSAIEQRQSHQPLYDVFMIGLTMDRAHLYARIDQRVDIMLERGLLDEIRTLIKSDDDWDLHSFQGIV